MKNMIIGIEIIDCEHCEKVILDWLKEHKDDIDYAMQQKLYLENRSDHKILAIGYLDTRVVKRNPQ
jgi:hypothetical protein